MRRQQPGIGLGQAKRLCQMAYDDRLEFLAKGLPSIHASAQSLWRASRRLGNEMPREAWVLRGFGEEESAKALILIDAVRCPKHRAPSRLGAIVNWFYSHLARLIYAESVVLQPVSVYELQELVDLSRKDYYLEGYAREAIIPNSHLFRRESLLYTDVVARESGELSWNDPLEIIDSCDSAATEEYRPPSLVLVEAMTMLGIFTLQGLKATSEVWGKVEFAGLEDRSIARELIRELVDRLVQEDLPRGDSVNPYMQTLFNYWQLPMYNLDFKKISVSMKQLLAEREVAKASLSGESD